jgi:hypothetical protein
VVILETDRVLLFCAGWPGLLSSYVMLPTIAGMTGTYHYTQLFSVEMGVSLTFFCMGTMILPISVSHVAWVGWDDRRVSPHSSVG